MKVKVLRSFLAYKPDQILDPPDGVANVWIKRGLVEPVKEQPELESTMVEHESENTMIGSAKARKVRR